MTEKRFRRFFRLFLYKGYDQASCTRTSGLDAQHSVLPYNTLSDSVARPSERQSCVAFRGRRQGGTRYNDDGDDAVYGYRCA